VSALIRCSNPVGVGSFPAPDYIFRVHAAAANRLSMVSNLDATSRAKWYDLVSTTVVGTLTNFGWTTASGWDNENGCLSGDGTDDYVSFGDVAVLDFGTGAFSVVAFFTPLDTPVYTEPIVGKLVGGQGWRLAITATMKLQGYVGTNTSNCRQQTGATTLQHGREYCLGMSYAGSGGDITLYVDGVAETMVAAGSAGAWNGSNAGALRLLATEA
jgi:hypothetical protein